MIWRTRFLLYLIVIVGISSPAHAEVLPKNSGYSKSDTSVLHKKNQQTLSLYFKKQKLGEIEAYSYRGGYMLPLGSLVKVLGFPIRVHPGDGLAQGVIQEKTFSLDTLAHSISYDTDKESYDKNLAVGNNDDIFIDATLLERFFPITFYVDTSALKLKIRLKKKLTTQDKNFFRTLWKVEEVTEPSKKVAVRNPDILPTLSEDNLLVLQPVVAESPLDDFIESYQDGERYFLPLDALARLLDFPIEVDLVNGTAEGWFIDEDRTFSLDLAKGKAEAGKEEFDFSKADAVIKDADIFVDSTILGKWFGFDFNVSYRDMTLVIGSEEALPFQKKMEREQRKERLEEQKKLFEVKNYPLIDNPYKLADWPFLDVNLNQEYRSTAENKQSITSYSLQSAGDLGYLNTKIFASGSSDDDMLQTLRIQGERKDNNGNLLGSLYATQYAIGDIDSATVPLVAQTSLGRGIRVSNRPLAVSAEFDSTDFTGDAQPGWEIELYRNETLLDFQTVGSDGRYQFLKVPVLFGSNTFRLVFYGPQGQIEEEVKQVFVDSSSLKKGEVIYEFSADEKSKDIFGLGNNQLNHPDGIRAIGGMEYGVTDNLSLRLSTVTTPIQDGTHDYVSTGLRTGFGRLFGGADVAYDTTNGGWATKFTALTGVSDVNLKLEQRFFDNFFSEERNPLGVLAKSQSEMDINSYFKLPLLRDINTGVNVLYEEFDNGLDQTTISNRLSKSILGVNITNALGVVLANEERFEGNLGLRGRIKSVLWGGVVNYRISPQEEIDSINISAQKNISQDLFLRLGFIKNLSLDDRTLTNGSLTWDLHKFRISALAEGDDNGSVFIGTTLNISFGKIPGRNQLHIQSNPMSYNGAVMADAFLDKNYNNLLDGEDEILDDPVFVVDNRKVKAEKGMAYEAQLIADRKVNVTLDPDSLEDPLWIPGVEGYSIIPRSGSANRLQFPVFATSEIDGTVIVEDDFGNTVPAKHFEIQLVDGQGKTVKKTKTEYDGFYLFDKVLPGTYTMEVAPNSLEKYTLSQPVKETIVIAGEGDFFNGYDIRLVRDAETAAPVEPVQVKEEPLPDEEYTNKISPDNDTQEE